jgi:transposase-like protein
MDGEQVASGAERAHESAIRRRRKWSAGEKAKIVREAQRPEAMLQEVAQRHGLHPSLLTRWRAQGRVAKKKVVQREALLLPVTVERRPRSESELVRPSGVRDPSSTSGCIEVEFSAGWRVHIQGVVDVPTLLQELARS